VAAPAPAPPPPSSSLGARIRLSSAARPHPCLRSRLRSARRRSSRRTTPAPAPPPPSPSLGGHCLASLSRHPRAVDCCGGGADPLVLRRPLPLPLPLPLAPEETAAHRCRHGGFLLGISSPSLLLHRCWLVKLFVRPLADTPSGGLASGRSLRRDWLAISPGLVLGRQSLRRAAFATSAPPSRRSWCWG